MLLPLRTISIPLRLCLLKSTSRYKQSTVLSPQFLCHTTSQHLNYPPSPPFLTSPEQLSCPSPTLQGVFKLDTTPKPCLILVLDRIISSSIDWLLIQPGTSGMHLYASHPSSPLAWTASTQLNGVSSMASSIPLSTPQPPKNQCSDSHSLAALNLDLSQHHHHWFGYHPQYQVQPLCFRWSFSPNWSPPYSQTPATSHWLFTPQYSIHVIIAFPFHWRYPRDFWASPLPWKTPQ